MDYKVYKVVELLAPDKHFVNEPVEVSGTPRGTTGNNKTVWGYLQSGGQFIQFSGQHLYPGMPEPTVSLLRASSESGIEVTVKGLFSTKTIEGHPGDLRLHRVDLNTVGIDFNEQ